MTGVRLAPLVTLLLAASVWTQTRIDARFGAYRAQQELLYVWSGDQVRLLFRGFEGVMADVYWLRTVQYYGGKIAFDKAEDKRFDLLEPLVQITTTLDPRFELAYRYGAIFLAESYPNGAGRPEAAVALLKKGIAANPDNWRLRWDLGYFEYLFLRDAKAGAETLIEASKREGAPGWLRNLAAGFLTWRGGERQMARVLWRQIYEEARAEPIQRNARFHIQYLDALDALDGLRGVVQRFGEVNGRLPRSLGELEAAGALPSPPVDPTGTRFDYDSETGAVKIARSSSLWRLVPPEER